MQAAHASVLQNSTSLLHCTRGAVRNNANYRASVHIVVVPYHLEPMRIHQQDGFGLPLLSVTCCPWGHVIEELLCPPNIWVAHIAFVCLPSQQQAVHCRLGNALLLWPGDPLIVHAMEHSAIGFRTPCHSQLKLCDIRQSFCPV